jgi:DNA-binding LacI/PurR family transcriptional regulator
MRDRYSGYRKAMEEAGIEIQPSWVQRNAETRVDIEHPTKESRAIAAQYLKSRPNVDALACGDVFMAIGVLEEAARLGIRVPDDLKVTGIDDFEVAKNCKPSLTTYRTPFREIGEQSFANLEALITGGSKHPEAEDETLIRGSICARGST